MSGYRNRASVRNHQNDLLNRSQQPTVGSPGFAVRKIARQYGVSLHHAKTIARIAGIGTEGAR